MMMKKNRLAAGIAALALILTLAPTAYAADPPDANLGVAMGSGTTVYTEATIADTSDCMASVIKWRQDALDTNVPWPTMTSTTSMRQYLKKNGISESDYLKPSWSQDIEKIALVRSLEQNATGIWAHQRPNGDNIFTLSSNGITGNHEIIAIPTVNTCTGAIDLWAGEKEIWVNNGSGVTGHYETLIDPSIKYFGMAGVNGYWTGQATTRESISTSSQPLNLSGKHVFDIKVKAADVDAAKLNIDKDTVIVGKTIEPKVTPKDKDMKYFLRGTWSVDDTAIATVDSNGVVTGVAEGTTNLTFTLDDGTEVMFPLTVRDLKITEVTAPADMTIESGVAPTLPSEVDVTYEDNTTGKAPVTWNAVPETDYNPLEAGDFTVNGTVEGWDDPVEVKVHRNAATITGVDYTKTSTVESGTPPTLPEKATVTWSNHTATTQETITWDPIPNDYKKREGGTFDIKGTVQGSDTPLEHTVTVNPATVTSVETPAKVTTPEKKKPELPETLKVTWSNGDVSDEAVTWDPINESDYTTAPKKFTVNGTVAGQAVTIDVEVVEAVIDSLVRPDNLKIDAGPCPVLPATVEAVWSNGLKTNEPVTWVPFRDWECKARTGGYTYTTGTVKGTDKEVQIGLRINHATITKAELKDADKKVTTPSGTEPTLPAKAVVNWSNGETSEETVTWDPVAKQQYSAREGGTFTVEGTVEDFAENPTTVTVEVNVLAATITGVKKPQAITTTVGKLPTLPKTLAVLYSNGDSVPTPVTWKQITAADVEKPGQFAVEGQVQGIDDPVSVTVTVTEDPTVEPTKDPTVEPTKDPEEDPADKADVKKNVVNEKKDVQGETKSVKLAKTGTSTSLLQFLALMGTIGGALIIFARTKRENLL